MPNLNATLVRGAVTSPLKKPGRAGAALPADRLTLPARRTEPGPLAAYRGICGFAESGPLPLTYPHVLAFPLALRLMTRWDFPLPVLGLVHTWIEITPYQAPHPTDSLELTVYAAELNPHRRGTEVTMATEARRAGELVWESRSGYLSRHARRPDPSAPVDGGPLRPGAGAEPPALAEWRLPGDLGRRYGAASGDRNPIHLHPLTARLFGFPRAIAHGMWTVARCLAEEPAPDTIRSVRAEFRAPVLLPATVTYAADATGFQVRGAGRVHLTGTVTRTGTPTPEPEAARDGRS